MPYFNASLPVLATADRAIKTLRGCLPPPPRANAGDAGAAHGRGRCSKHQYVDVAAGACVCAAVTCELSGAQLSSAQLSIIWMANEPMRPPAVPSAIEIDLAFTPCLFQALFFGASQPPCSGAMSSRPVI